MKYSLPILVLLGLSLSAFLVSAQPGCDTAGQAAYINSTADYNKYSACTSLPGIVFGSGSLSGNITLGNLTTITRVSGVGFGIIIQSSNLTQLNFPALNSFDGDQFRFINNLNLVGLSAGQAISVVSGSNVEIVFQNNPVLSQVSLGFNNIGSGAIAVGGGSAQGLDGLIGSLSFPFLTASGDLRVTNNGLNTNSNANAAISLNLPQLRNVNLIQIVNNTLTNVNIPSSVTATDNFSVTGNRFSSSNFIINLLSVPSILFSNNIASGSGVFYQFIVDNLSSILSDITISANAGLNAVSFAAMQYPNGAFTVQDNNDLASFNMPRGVVMTNNGFTFNNNGNTAPAPQRLLAIIGVQNLTSSALTVNNNAFSDVIFPALTFVSQDFTMSGNLINGRLIANTTFTVGGSVSLTNNNKGASTRFDLSGLAYVGQNLILDQNAGQNNGPILLSQLYVVGTSVTITSNSGFGSLSFGNLGFIGTLNSNNQNTITYTAGSQDAPNTVTQLININGNNNLQTITTASTASSGWSTDLVSIINNGALTTLTLGGLTQAAYISITGNNALTTLTANQLSCLGAATVTANSLNTVSLTSLKSSNKFQVTNAANTCAANIGSASNLGCIAACYACTGTTPCNGGNSATLVQSQCGQSGNAFASAAGCAAVNFNAYTTTGATLTPGTVNNGGGNGNTGNPATTTGNGTGNGNGNGNGSTSSNSNAATTTVTNSRAATTTAAATTRNVGDAATVTASIMLIALIAAFFM